MADTRGLITGIKFAKVTYAEKIQEHLINTDIGIKGITKAMWVKWLSTGDALLLDALNNL